MYDEPEDDGPFAAFDRLADVLQPFDKPGYQLGPPEPGGERSRTLAEVRAKDAMDDATKREYVGILASLGFDLETTADAIDESVESTARYAEERLAEIADGITDDDE